MSDALSIRRCLELALLGRGLVGNGALVGAVLVRKEKIIAEGFHAGFGKLHAERALLDAFNGDVLPDDILYVNLEPCIPHPSKKNPPCSDILLKRGVRHVVCGMRDPDPRVAGNGISLLRSEGVDVSLSPLGAQCMRLNRGFVSARTKARPWVTLKSATTSEGAISNPDGSSLKITTDEQDRWSHTSLRATHDAIMVGVGTILADDPSLTTRYADAPPPSYRIVLDPNLRIPSRAKVLTDDHASRTILIVDPDIIRRAPEKLDPLTAKGARVFPAGTDTGGNIDFDELWNVLLTPKGDYHGLTSILLEGGTRTWEIFRKAGVVDEEVTLIGH